MVEEDLSRASAAGAKLLAVATAVHAQITCASTLGGHAPSLARTAPHAFARPAGALRTLGTRGPVGEVLCGRTGCGRASVLWLAGIAVSTADGGPGLLWPEFSIETGVGGSGQRGLSGVARLRGTEASRGGCLAHARTNGDGPGSVAFRAPWVGRVGRGGRVGGILGGIGAALAGMVVKVRGRGGPLHDGASARQGGEGKSQSGDESERRKHGERLNGVREGHAARVATFDPWTSEPAVCSTALALGQGRTKKAGRCYPRSASRMWRFTAPTYRRWSGSTERCSGTRSCGGPILTIVTFLAGVTALRCMRARRRGRIPGWTTSA